MGDNMKKRAKRTMKEKLELVKEIGIYLSDKEGKKKLVREKFGIHPTYYYQLRMNFLPLIQKAGYESWEEFLSDPGSVDKVMERGSETDEKKENQTEKRDEDKAIEKITTEKKEKSIMINELKEDMKKVIEPEPKQEKPEKNEIEKPVVKVPIWKKKWFWIVLICSSVGVLFLILNFKKKEMNNEVEKDIDVKTKENKKAENFELPPEF